MAPGPSRVFLVSTKLPTFAPSPMSRAAAAAGRTGRSRRAAATVERSRWEKLWITRAGTDPHARAEHDIGLDHRSRADLAVEGQLHGLRCRQDHARLEQPRPQTRLHHLARLRQLGLRVDAQALLRRAFDRDAGASRAPMASATVSVR